MTNNLSDLIKNDFFILTKTISDKMRARSDNMLRSADLSFSQLYTLIILDSKSGLMTQKEIETSLQVSHNATLGLVSRLEKKGYVVSYTDKQDKRQKNVKLTLTGKGKVDLVLSDKQNDFLKVLSWMEKDEYDSLIQTLNKIVAKIDELN